MSLEKKFQNLFLQVSTKAALSSYYHVGKNIRLEKNVSPTFFLNKKCSWWDYSPFKCHSITDHYCGEYYKHLTAIKW